MIRSYEWKNGKSSVNAALPLRFICANPNNTHNNPKNGIKVLIVERSSVAQSNAGRNPEIFQYNNENITLK